MPTALQTDNLSQSLYPNGWSIRSFPQKNAETCNLSITHAMAKQPLTVRHKAASKKAIPEESNENTDTSGLTSIVKIGEKTKMTNVLLPTKPAKRTAQAGKIRNKANDKLTAK